MSSGRVKGADLWRRIRARYLSVECSAAIVAGHPVRVAFQRSRQPAGTGTNCSSAKKSLTYLAKQLKFTEGFASTLRAFAKP
jgi:hypothetical protein